MMNGNGNGNNSNSQNNWNMVNHQQKNGNHNNSNNINVRPNHNSSQNNNNNITMGGAHDNINNSISNQSQQNGSQQRGPPQMMNLTSTGQVLGNGLNQGWYHARSPHENGETLSEDMQKKIVASVQAMGNLRLAPDVSHEDAIAFLQRFSRKATFHYILRRAKTCAKKDGAAKTIIGYYFRCFVAEALIGVNRASSVCAQEQFLVDQARKLLWNLMDYSDVF